MEKKMKYKDEKILYIIYHDRIPFEVYLESSGYDFEIYNNDKNHIIFCLSSSGFFCNDEMELPRLAFPQNPPTTQVWLEKGIKIIGNHPGIKILKHPILLKTDVKRSRNPFSASHETCEIVYCLKCKKHYDEYGCIEHGFQYCDE
jgi:hypothetical protein